MSRCDYCRGPITGAGHTGRPWPGRVAATYCCFGCLSLGEQRQQEGTSSPATQQSGWKLDGIGIRLGIGLLAVGQSMIFGLALNLHDDVPQSVRWVAQNLILAATVVVLFLLGGPLFRAAYSEFRRGRLTIEALFLLTMTGAMAASLQAHVTGRGKIYFEVVSILLVVYTLGKVIGARSRAAALDGSRAWAGQLETCRLADEGRVRVVPVTEVLPGDVVEVNPGETFAVDGVIRNGVGFVSEAAVSGEPFAVVRRPGDRVLAGAASHDATFRVEATARGTERQVDRLLRAVEEARDRPVSLQAQADALGRWFLPLVVLTAIGTFGYWSFLTEAGWEAGLFNAMSVLLVACPCVIGLATPIVIWSALARLAERGVIVRAGDAVERLAEIDRVMLDKTGTLTDDSFALLDIATTATGTDRATLLGWLAVVQERSNHPVARPFAKLPRPFAPRDEPRVLELKVVPGCGVEAWIEAGGKAHTLQIGRPEWIESLASGGREPPVLMASEERTNSNRGLTPSARQEKQESVLARELKVTGHRVDVTLDGELVAVAVLAESLRDSTPDALAEFARLGLPVEVLTGDTAERAEALNLPATRAGLLPDDKRAIVEGATNSGGKPLFVGDGINDAAALASAHVGIALATGTDLAVCAADVTLYHTDLRVLPWAIELSREAVRAVRRNMLRALGYNLIGMTLAACGVLHPVMAAVLMLVSSMSLIFSSTRVGVHRACSVKSPTTEQGTRSHTRAAAIHATAFTLQGVSFLLLLGSVQATNAVLLVAGFALVGVWFSRAWWNWPAIPHALDMCFGMLTLGNLGMLLGWWADNDFAPLHDHGCCACVAAMHEGVMKPWMWVGMLVFANAAMLWLSRHPAPHGAHRVAMYTGGNAGMVLGMLAGGWCAAQIVTDSVAFGVGASFVGMTAGMLAGMLAGTWLVEQLLGVVSAVWGVRRWFATPPPSPLSQGERGSQRKPLSPPSHAVEAATADEAWHARPTGRGGEQSERGGVITHSVTPSGG